MARKKPASKTRTKHIGDVLGISRARVRKPVAGAAAGRSRRPKGIEVGPQSGKGTRLKPARTVGGVRGRGR